MTLRRLSVAVVLVLTVLALPVGITSAGVADVGTDHGLDETEAIQAFEEDGYAEGDVHGYDMDVAIADDRDDLPVDDIPPALVADLSTDYLLIDNREEFERTYRILIPREYVTPYLREDVESLNSDHTADFDRVRDGRYLEIVIRMDGAGQAVLPIDGVAGWSYDAVERFDNRFGDALGVSLMGESEEWQYLDGDELEREGALAIEADDPDSVLVQYDARPEDTDEYWLNAPRDGGDQPVYYFVKDSDETVYIVSTGEEAPAVRFKEEATHRDRFGGWANDARQIPDQIRDTLDVDIPGNPFASD